MKNLSLLLGLALSCLACTSERTTLQLPQLISDGMVLQRDAPLTVWGWASPGCAVSIQIAEATATTTATPEGTWTATLPAMAAGGPYRLQVSTPDTTALVKDVLLGDVWICSGQSNMETTMERARPLYEEELATANYPQIRYFEVPKTFDFQGPRDTLGGGHWEAITRETLPHISAVAYFFGKRLHTQYEVPIGLINTSLGGSPAEAWMSTTALEAFPHYLHEVQHWQREGVIDSTRQAEDARWQQWHSTLDAEDPGLPGNWKAGDLANTTDWNAIQVPGHWNTEPLASYDGSVWYRTTFTLAPSNAGKAGDLLLGCIVDADSTFINGQFVGRTTYQYPPRRYSVPTGLLKAGENSLVVRVINEKWRGGFVPEKPYQLTVGNQVVDLQGEWEYRLGTKMEALPSQTFIRWKPNGLYNAMIAPLLPYQMKGVIWYQGESNADTAEEYDQLLPAMITDWRSQWQQGDFPFLIVQLANFMEARDTPQESGWARLREAQRKTLRLPNTGLAVAIDVGEWNDIHPLNKQAVGERLASEAFRVAYHDTLSPGSPLIDHAERRGQEVVLHFTQIGSGLVAQGGPLQHFALAGPDGNYRWAQARIEGNTVVVSHPQTTEPTHVRYAWADNPEGANLYNQEGFPASPFQVSLE